MPLTAGHSFDSLDRCTTCPRTWFQIMHVTQDCIGLDGIAHIGALNLSEYESIEARRNGERLRVWEAVLCSATGSGPVAREPDCSGAEAA